MDSEAVWKVDAADETKADMDSHLSKEREAVSCLWNLDRILFSSRQNYLRLLSMPTLGKKRGTER
jgi:hypothetical protein